jgi:hypothetical protein
VESFGFSSWFGANYPWIAGLGQSFSIVEQSVNAWRTLLAHLS